MVGQLPEYRMMNAECRIVVFAFITGLLANFNGKPLFQQGWVSQNYLFPALEESNYIPFTFAELLDPADEQDKKHLDYFNSYKDKLTAFKGTLTAE